MGFNVKPESYRTTEWLGLKRPLETTQFQQPCDGQGHLPLNKVAQGPINLVLNAIKTANPLFHSQNFQISFTC